MGPVYAARLTVHADAVHTADGLFDEVVNVCHEWLSQVARSSKIILPVSPLDSFDSGSSVARSTFRVEYFAVDRLRAWRATGVHPFGSLDTNLELRTELQVRDSCDGEVVVTVRLLLGSIEDVLRPVEHKIRRPRLMLDLVNAFPGLVWMGNMEMSDSPFYLDELETVHLSHKILSPSRLCPMVVISRKEDESLALADEEVANLANQLAGVASVHVLPSFQSAYDLTRGMGGQRRLSCFLGAIRVYWPSLSLWDDPYRHPLYTLYRMESIPDMASEVFALVSQASALSIGSDPEMWSIIRTYTSRKQEAADLAFKKRLDDARRMEMRHEQDRMALDELLNDADTRVRETESRLNTFLESQRELEEIVWKRDATIADLRRERNESIASRQVEIEEQILAWSRCKTVADVVKFVESLVDKQHLVFLPEAHESARQCSYKEDMSRVLNMMLRINRVAQRYHRYDPLGFKALFESEGETEYKADISDTARTQYAADYRRQYRTESGVRPIMLGPHVAIGNGTPTFSVVAYWHVDEESRRFVVGHVGRHLHGRRAT